MAIRILAPHEAAKIAAGEVIERPASVVKELLENALDAGARQITVEVREGGLALIRVVDDGCGIEPGELRLAFERHATSKLRAEDDLWRIATLGFRGEALPSIAAAGDVELISRTRGNDRAARIRFKDGVAVDEGSAASAPGTTVTVRALFSMQPARLSFLRGSGAEASQVSTVVMQYALGYPEVAFTLSVDGRVALQTPGTGRLPDTVGAVYGTAIAEAMIDVDAPPANEGEAALRGVVAHPAVHRSSRQYIGLYVNRRWVRNRSLTFAVEDAYQGMLPAGRHPLAVIDVRVPADEVDVNVHPTKAEVRLRRERDLFALIQRTVRRALSDRVPVTTPAAGAWTIEASASVAPLVLRAQPAQATLRAAPAFAPADAAENAAEARSVADRLPMLRPVGQVGSTYVVAEGPDGMYLIDQHAAHERVLYERFRDGVRAGLPETQGLLDPLTIELGAAHQALVIEHADAFRAIGFDIEHFGDAVFIVRAVPAAIAGKDAGQRIVELLDRLQRDDGPDDSAHRVAASLACHASVRAGMALSDAEQRELIAQLEQADAPRTCPHGRPTLVHLTSDAIAREFGRR